MGGDISGSIINITIPFKVMRLDEVPVVVGVDGEGEHSLNHPRVLPGAPKVKRYRR